MKGINKNNNDAILYGTNAISRKESLLKCLEVLSCITSIKKFQNKKDNSE
jgi:hypothetical protein